MFVNDVNKKEEIRSIVIQDLRDYGIKYRHKKQRYLQETRHGQRVFKTALHLLPMQTVTLTSGQQLVIPKVVHDLCSFIMAKVQTEGLFRKGGSKSRQNEIKLSLDAGCYLSDDHHEIDIASVLKTFFRELPEPLFPLSYHDLFLRCTILKECKLEAIMSACLLLPPEHLNTLAYFMQFLNKVTQYSHLNKMDAYNLSVIIGPTLFPVEEKLSATASLRLTSVCELCKLLIENASNIGLLSEHIIDRVASLSSSMSLTDDENQNKKKKKRRSGMFNGLKKMVGGKSDENEIRASTPDLLSTPSLSKSAKKRRIESISGFSNKKRSDLINYLPQGTTLSTPFTPSRTPVSVNPNPWNVPLEKSPAREKKSQWNLGNKRQKNTKPNVEETKRRSGTKAMLERRWSAVSQVAGFRRNKKRNSCAASLADLKKKIEADTAKSEPVIPEPDYVKISRSEYEEIKSRVSEIERRLSVELEHVQDDSVITSSETCNNGVVQVQTAYERTLDEAEPLSPTTDQLARRLSKELKIRRSLEQKPIRSPSARKIGSLRRRSRELERQNARIQRTKSWHVQNLQIIPRVNLKRGRPNTVMTGLKVPTPGSVDPQFKSIPFTPVTRNATRASSFNGEPTPSPFRRSTRSASNSNLFSSKSNSLQSEKWVSAEGFFKNLSAGDNSDAVTGRPSLARLRSQNAGMVLAKAKLFDGLIDVDHTESEVPQLPPRNKVVKIGTQRNVERASSRFRKRSTPRRRPLKNSFNSKSETDCVEKENLLSETCTTCDTTSKKTVLKDCNRIGTPDCKNCVTPKRMPKIKRALAPTSSTRLHGTPLTTDSKQTPLKVVPISERVY